MGLRSLARRARRSAALAGVVTVGATAAIVAGGPQRTAAPFTDAAQVSVALQGAEAPAYVPGLVLWLDGADQDTLFADPAGTVAATPGDPVARWADKSAQGNDAVQLTTGARPTIAAAGSGTAPLFDGDDRLELDPTLLPTGTSDSTTFVVARLDAPGGVRAAFVHGTDNAGRMRWYGSSGSLAYLTASVQANPTTTGWPVGTAGLLTGAFTDGTTGTIWMRGTDEASASGGYDTLAGGAMVGANSSVQPWIGTVQEILVYDRALSPAERRTVERHLADQWGLTLAPAAPTGLTATASAPGELTLAWAAPADTGGSPITDYVVELRTSPSGPWTVAADGVSPSTGATITGLVNGSDHEVRVRAANAVGTGNASASVQRTTLGPPAAPTSLTATAGDRSIAVAWSPPASDGGSPVTGYTVTAEPGGAVCSTNSAAITTRTQPDNGGWLSSGYGSLGYVLAGFDGGTDRVSLPVGVSYTTTGTARWTWASSTADTRALQGPSGGSRKSTTWYGNTMSQTFTFASAASRTMRIYALDWDGGNRTQAVSITGDGPARSVSLSGFSSGRWIDVPITVASGGSVTITTTRTSGANAVIAGVFLDPAPTSCTLTGLTAGTSYDVTVSATNAVGTGPASTAVTATPFAVPDAPAVNGVVAGDASATVSWTAGADNGSAVTSWQVTAYTDAAGTVAATGTTNPQTLSGAGTGSLTFTGLTNGTTYRFRVAAVNAAGAGSASAVSTAVTPAAPPGAPTGLAVDRTIVTTVAGSGASSFADGTGTAAAFNGLRGIARDASGNLYVAERNNHRIRRITPAGVVTTYAGNGTTAVLNDPYGVAVAPDGTVYVAEYGGHRIRRIDVNGTVTTLAGSGTAGGADGTGTAATFHGPTNLVVDAAGNLLVAEYSGNRIRMVTPAGVVTTLAGSGSAGTADGTGTAATFNGPTGLRLDALGNLYVTDQTSGRIRRVTPAAVVTTVPGGTGFGTPLGIEVDAAGNLYVTEWSSQRVRRITPGGTVSIIAGTGASGGANGPGASAAFASPAGILLEADGSLVVTEGAGNRVRRISPAGSGSLALSWTAPTNPGSSPISDYVVEARESPSGSWTTVPDGVSTATTATITGLTNGTAYDVRVSAVNATVAGLPSSVVTRTPGWTPGAPTGVALAPTTDAITVSWTAPATGGAAIQDYLVEYRTAPSGPWTVLADGVSTATTATISGLTNGTTYDVRVTAGNAHGAGPASTVVTATTLEPWSPADLATVPALWLDAAHDPSVSLSGSSVTAWANRTGGTITAVQATAGSQPTRIASAMNGRPVLRFDGNDWLQIPHDASLEAGDDVTFVGVVRMATTAGRYSIYHAADNNEHGHFFIEGGNAFSPVGYSVAVPGAFQSSAAGTASPAADLVVYRRNGPGITHSWRVDGLARTPGAPNGGNSYVVSTRPKMVGARYTTGQQGFNGDMAELLLVPTALSDADAARLEGYLAHKWGLAGSLPTDHPYKTEPPSRTVPAAPIGLTLTAGIGQVQASWVAPDIGGSPNTDYALEYRVSPSGSWTPFADGTSTATTATITGLSGAVTYDIRVAAVNSIGQGSWSTAATAAQPTAGTLDRVTPVASAAYGLRRLDRDWTGPLVGIRRSSDNALADIGFAADGGLDTEALLAHVGSGSGFVHTWYDQSGSGRHAVEAGAGRQPRIVLNGVVETNGGRPAVVFDGTDDRLVTGSNIGITGTAPFTLSAVQAHPATATNDVWASFGTAVSGRAFHWMVYATAGQALPGFANVTQSAAVTLTTPSIPFTASVARTGSTASSWEIRQNDQPRSFTPGNDAVVDVAAGPLLIGDWVGGSYAADVRLSELLLFPAVVASAERSAIALDQGTHFGIPQG